MRNIIIIACIATLIGCSTSPRDLTNFDEQTWIKDTNGCQGLRLEMLDQLKKNISSLKGLNQNELYDLIGKPDRHELYKRSQKFFYYQITPGEECQSELQDKDIFLSIRFNATGLAKEVQLIQ